MASGDEAMNTFATHAKELLGAGLITKETARVTEGGSETPAGRGKARRGD
jgi:hypothetical protein